MYAIRRQQANLRGEPSHAHAEHTAPVPNARTRRLDDVRSRPEGYDGSRPLERRGAAEVIVLE